MSRSRISRPNRVAIKAAAALIAVELADGQDVRIPGFGTFYVKDMRVGGYGERVQDFVQGVVRFRPYARLKDAVARPQLRCPAERTWTIMGDTDRCIHRDDHSTDHTDEKGRSWS